MSQFEFEEDLPVLGPLEASDIKRGICRHMRNLNYSVLVEFRLKSKRRVDVMGLNRNGKFAIVEIKSSVNDFRSDKKWRDYRPFADQLYFAVANGFPIEILPKDCGVYAVDTSLEPSWLKAVSFNSRVEGFIPQRFLSRRGMNDLPLRSGFAACYLPPSSSSLSLWVD